FTDEVQIATALPGTITDFRVGDLYTGTGVVGRIAKISDGGSSVDPAWVTLPNEQGGLRGNLMIDPTGAWGGDLIAITTTGGVWRVTAAGIATKVAQVGVPIGLEIEGTTIIPNDQVLRDLDFGDTLTSPTANDSGPVFGPAPTAPAKVGLRYTAAVSAGD